MSDAFKFGAFERILGSTLLLIIWSFTMVAVMIILTEHGDPTAETGRMMELMVNAGLVAIGLLFWGRPISVLLGRIWGRIKRAWRARIPDSEEVSAE